MLILLLMSMYVKHGQACPKCIFLQNKITQKYLDRANNSGFAARVNCWKKQIYYSFGLLASWHLQLKKNSGRYSHTFVLHRYPIPHLLFIGNSYKS